MQAILRRWWWVPALFLAMLLVKAWVVGGMLQSDAQAEAAAAAGIDVDRVEMVDGLNVNLTGFTDTASRDAAVASVAALDSSWDVTGELDGSAGGAGSAETDESTATTTSTPPTTAAPTTAAAAAASADVTFTATVDGAVVLTGTVADEARRTALVDAAVASFGADRVTDELVVDADAIGADGGVVTIIGEAGSDAQRDEWIDNATTAAQASNMELVEDVTVVSVEQNLNALVELEPIEFDYNQATIRDTSTPTLDRAAALINANPDVGRLKVVGHTDSDGPANANLRLSQRRARAVVDYLVESGGVDPERLEAEGRGENELRVDPEVSEDDRQRNRRIEWELLG